MNSRVRQIFCVACNQKTEARLISGADLYPHRYDLHALPFWQCPTCGNCVGCHHRTSNPTAPLGCIPSPELRKLRKQIHARLDPLWVSGRFSRTEVYARLSDHLGWQYHTAKTRSVEEAQKVLDFVKTMEEV